MRTLLWTLLLIGLLCSCDSLSETNERVGSHVSASEVAKPGDEAKINASAATVLPLDRWTYLAIDSTKTMWGDYAEPDWLRYFGLATGDIDGNGQLDVITGRNVYFHPGGNGAGQWRKADLGDNLDANLFFRTAGGEALILAEALPDVYAIQYNDQDRSWTKRVVAQVPPTGHHNGQGYRIAALMPREAPQVILSSQGGLYVLEPKEQGQWPVTLVGKDASDEGFAVADMDGDGDADLVAGYRQPGQDAEVPTVVVWYENPGEIREDWPRHPVGNTAFATDRVEAADLDGDGKMDVIVAEERYPGLEPDASLYVYFQRDTGFVRTTIVTQFSMNNLDAADLDRDGDIDLVTAEHKGPDLALQIWENNGKGEFSKREIDTGKESHLGARTVDIDGDGDLDIVSIGWDQHRFVHLWRNDAIQR